MESVGVRDLKNHLSEYLRRVAAGATILITDRGRVVAELRKPVPPIAPWLTDVNPSFWEKVARGEIRLAQRPHDPSLYLEPSGVPSMPDGTAQRLIDEDRDDQPVY